MGQSKAKPHPKKQRTLKRSTRPFELIHVDLLVGTTRSLGESIKYLLIIVDDYSRYTWGIGLKKKDEAVVQFRRWRRAMRARYGEKWPVDKIKFVRSDNGGEFISDEITFDESEEGFEMQPSVAYIHN